MVQLSGAVIVGGARDDEVEVVGDGSQRPPRQSVVLLVVDLDTAQTRRGELEEPLGCD